MEAGSHGAGCHGGGPAFLYTLRNNKSERHVRGRQGQSAGGLGLGHNEGREEKYFFLGGGLNGFCCFDHVCGHVFMVFYGSAYLLFLGTAKVNRAEQTSTQQGPKWAFWVGGVQGTLKRGPPAVHSEKPPPQPKPCINVMNIFAAFYPLSVSPL